MSENNYGALMMKSPISASDNINTILSPGLYLIPPANSSSPDPAGGILTVHAGNPIRRVFISDATIAMVSTYNSTTSSWSAWNKPAGRLLKVRVITASGPYIETPGTNYCIAEIQGAGGAGGGALGGSASQVSVATGGNAGAYIKHQFDTVPSGAMITIGSGGKGVPAANGNPGGATTFGTLTAPGGMGGIYYSPTTAPTYSFNSASVTNVSGGNLANVSGIRGQPGQATSPVYGGSGDGGSSVLGGGGDGRGAINAPRNGNKSSGYGSAGGGASCGGGSTGNAAGGDGADGVVILWEYA